MMSSFKKVINLAPVQLDPLMKRNESFLIDAKTTEKFIQDLQFYIHKSIEIRLRQQRFHLGIAVCINHLRVHRLIL